MIGGSVLLVLIVLTTIRNNWHRRPKVEASGGNHQGRAAPGDAAGAGPTMTTPKRVGQAMRSPQTWAPALPRRLYCPPLDSGLSKGEAEDTSPLTAPLASITGGQEPPAAAPCAAAGGCGRLARSKRARLTGIRRVNPTDPPIRQFSWMTGLLPYIGHGQLYQQFDFKQPLTKGKNLQLGAVIVRSF